MTYEEAEAFAFRKIREAYGEELPLEDRSIWQLSRSFCRENPEGPSGAVWSFMLEPRDLDHGVYYADFRDNDPEGTLQIYGNVPD